MKLRRVKFIPAILTGSVVFLICLLEMFPRSSPSQLAQRLEWMTYDWRVRQAAAHPRAVATNLGAVFIDENSLRVLNEAVKAKWPWTPDIHGFLARRLAEQGARRVAFDILFAELDANEKANGAFARDLQQAGNVYLAAFGETLGTQWRALPPAPLFRTNALAIGHATSDEDADSILRRAKPFKDDPQLGRLWHLGILLAAAELNLDLDRAEVTTSRLVLRGPGGLFRSIPLDEDGFFSIDWALKWNDPRLTVEGFEDVIARQPGEVAQTAAGSKWNGRLVVVGSIGAGNNISDVGATPVDRRTYLISKHWNVANAVITGTFIERTPRVVNLLLIIALGALGALATWNLAALRASILIVVVAVVYWIIATALFVQNRTWLPIVLPVFGGLALTYAASVTYRLFFEEREKRRVRGIFSRLVSPEVVTELLAADDIRLGGMRRQITVFFADVRGFTEMTDSGQARAEEYVRQNKLPHDQAEAYYDQHANEMLDTVNGYLAVIADQIKKHGGTLDKYIGDCVMAFWGAPTANEKHAALCVRAAIDAQRAIYELNQERFTKNKRREEQNAERASAGQPPLPLLPILSLGTGINTGTAVVGLMGSDAHILNYTVFGREVNIASRLEGVSGRGRIFISDATHQELKRDDPALAATCIAQAPQMLKGIQGAVKIYEVPWKTAAVPAAPTPVLRPATTASVAAPTPTPAQPL